MNRSCKFCKWVGEKEILLGKIYWCGANSEETTPDRYCENFQQKRAASK